MAESPAGGWLSDDAQDTPANAMATVAAVASWLKLAAGRFIGAAFECRPD